MYTYVGQCQLHTNKAICVSIDTGAVEHWFIQAEFNQMLILSSRIFACAHCFAATRVPIASLRKRALFLQLQVEIVILDPL